MPENNSILKAEQPTSVDLGLVSTRPALLRRLGQQLFRPSLIQAGAVIADQGFCSVANFLTGVLVARACTKSEYGVFVLGLTILRFMTGLQNSLVSIPYTIQYPRCNVNERAAYLGSTLIHQLFICIVTAIGFFAASRFFAWRGAEPAMVSTMFMLSVASAAFMIREFIRLVMLAELRIWLNLSMSLVANTATIAAMFVAYKTENLDSARAYLMIAFCSGIPALAVTTIYWKKMKIFFHRITADFEKNFHLGKWLVARAFLDMGSTSLYPLILATFYGTAEAAVYGVCFQLASLSNPLIHGISNFLVPKAAQSFMFEPKKMQSLVFRISLSILVFSIIVYSAILVIGDLLLIKIYGQIYQGNFLILSIIFFAISTQAIFKPYAATCDGFGKTKHTFYGKSLSFGVTISVGVVLTYKYTSLGAAFALLIAHLLAGLFYYRLFHKSLGS